MKTVMTLCLLALAAGCGKSDEATKTAEPTKPKASPTDAAPPAPDFAAWDPATKEKAWQGSWVTKENGTLQAWTITGDKVQTWDGEKDEEFKLRVIAPCRAQFVNEKGYMYPREFSSVDGKLRFRAGGAGYRKGPEAILCDMSGDIYTLDAAGKCTLWEKERREDWIRKDGECGFKKNADGAEVFFHGGVNEGEFAIEKDAILSRSSFETEPAADHAAAKALRDSKAAPENK